MIFDYSYIFNNSNLILQVNARVLPTPTIKYHPTSKEHDVRPNGGAWSLKDKKLATGATLGSWSVLAFLSQNELPDQGINPFVREFVNTCQDSGMVIKWYKLFFFLFIQASNILLFLTEYSK
ncbi:MAG: hypothetical protein I3270_02380 [Candidatus Moeniiplasma glomeromycotorum]|nr:hypothetical protein [Candidatus Moeniiplasma glomeromycotorum]